MGARYHIHQGDVITWCADHAAAIARGEKERFHAVFTDWPYLIDFLNGGDRDAPHRVYQRERPADVAALADLLGLKAWEAAAVLWYRDVARALASVCHPGAQHLGFAGARTDDLLAMGLRAAGWVVQDKLMYLYPSGKPHGLDIARAIDARRTDDPAEIYAVTGFLRAARDRAGVTNAQIDAAFGTNGMAGHWTSQASQPIIPSPEQWAQLKAMLGFDDSMDALMRKLNGHKHNPGHAYHQRQVVTVRKGQRRGRVPIINAKGETYAVTRPHLPDAQRWDGYHTHLKPAYETLIYAYLPGAGTYADTAIGCGTGGLHIAGSRVGPDPEVQRWPANVAFQHDPGCVHLGWRTIPMGAKANDVQDDPAAPAVERIPVYRCTSGCPVRALEKQSDAGARFFFTVKPTAWERDFGLDGGAQHMQARLNPGGLSREARFAPKPSYNPHPTIKAIRSLQYFVGLIRRPPDVRGRLLVPFSGSGSEMIAALLDPSWAFVQGVELDQDVHHPGIYVDIAHRRIVAWLAHGRYDAVAEAVAAQRALERSAPAPDRVVVMPPVQTRRPPPPPRSDATQTSLFDLTG